MLECLAHELAQMVAYRVENVNFSLIVLSGFGYNPFQLEIVWILGNRFNLGFSFVSQ